MSELLLRGWNVAVPVVDVGDDVFVIDDSDKTTYRLQVKTALAETAERGHVAQYALSRKQLITPLNIELIYMLLARVQERWRYLIIPRKQMASLRRRFEATPRKGPGRRPSSAATNDSLNLAVELGDSKVKAWGAPLDDYFDSWPQELPIVESGPGSQG